MDCFFTNEANKLMKINQIIMTETLKTRKNEADCC
jgi:hypothetical protein